MTRIGKEITKRNKVELKLFRFGKLTFFVFVGFIIRSLLVGIKEMRVAWFIGFFLLVLCLGLVFIGWVYSYGTGDIKEGNLKKKE